MVAGLVPYWLTRWRVAVPFPGWAPLRVVGALLLVVGVVVLVQAFAYFVAQGGTPAPVAPTERLVVTGLFRHVRNPMYLAVASAIIGQGLVFGQPVLFVYALFFGALVAAFVRFYEEPVLRARFGDEYATYRRAVPAWWPRLRPWRGDR
jgi:protein-S-isoprenylcysteine O-methyltransferase Ste14